MSDDHIIDLLASELTQEERLFLRPSPKRRKHVRYLLARNKAGILSKQEELELNVCGEIEHVIQLIKARNLN